MQVCATSIIVSVHIYSYTTYVCAPSLIAELIAKPHSPQNNRVVRCVVGGSRVLWVWVAFCCCAAALLGFGSSVWTRCTWWIQKQKQCCLCGTLCLYSLATTLSGFGKELSPFGLRALYFITFCVSPSFCVWMYIGLADLVVGGCFFVISWFSVYQSAVRCVSSRFESTDHNNTERFPRVASKNIYIYV